jgi:TPR repeat protein
MHANDMNIDTKESIDWLHKSAGKDILSSAKYDFKRAKNFSSRLIKSYMKVVYKGYAKSQYLLGTMYYEKGGAKDMSKSKYWIKKAYENSDKDICKKAEEFWNKRELWNYKDYKYKNIDEPTDVEKIRYIGNQALTPEEQLLKAIFGAHDSFVIGEAYMSGKTILRDPKEAIQYYKSAAEHGDYKGDERGGNDEAKYKLGVIYYEENSVQDYSESKYWINKAFEGTDTEISKKAEEFWNKHEFWKY